MRASSFFVARAPSPATETGRSLKTEGSAGAGTAPSRRVCRRIVRRSCEVSRLYSCRCDHGQRAIPSCGAAQGIAESREPRFGLGYLPPCSPGLNPIEPVVTWIASCLFDLGVRTSVGLVRQSVGPSSCRRFRHPRHARSSPHSPDASRVRPSPRRDRV